MFIYLQDFGEIDMNLVTLKFEDVREKIKRLSGIIGQICRGSFKSRFGSVVSYLQSFVNEGESQEDNYVKKGNSESKYVSTTVIPTRVTQFLLE